MTYRSWPAAPALAFALLLLAGCKEESSETVLIGVAGPLSLANGESMRKAAEMAVEEINRQGVDGKRIELVFKDDEASPEKAIQVAGELRDDPRVVAVIGHVNSAATLAAAKVYNDPAKGLLQISPASTAPSISEAGPWTFRVCPSDLAHGPALARYAYERLGKRRATVLYRNDDYGRGVMESFSEAFRKAGGSVVGKDPFLSPSVTKSQADLVPYLERARRDGADAVLVASQADGGLLVLQAAKGLGYDAAVLGADGLTSLKDAGSIAEGVYISSAFLPDRNSEQAKRFVGTYAERYNELPDHRGAMTYDAMYVLADALRKVGGDRKALRDYVAGIGTSTPAIEGVSGKIRFDENGDVEGKDVAISVVRGGKLVTAGS